MRGAAELVPRGSDLLHERNVRRGQPLVLRKQRMRLVDLRAKPLLQRCHHVRLGRQGATGAAVAVPHEMAEMRWRRLLEAVGVAGRQAGRIAEVVEVVVRGKARRVAEVVEGVVGREVGVKRVVKWGRRMVAAAAAGIGRGQRVAVAAGHGESPEPYRWRDQDRLLCPEKCFRTFFFFWNFEIPDCFAPKKCFRTFFSEF